MIRVVVPGAAGRMGRMVIEALVETPGVTLSAAVERPGHPQVGHELLGISVGENLAQALEQADVFIDFTTPTASTRAVALAAEHGVAAVIGTTGFDSAEEAAIGAAATRIPIVKAANFSTGVSVLLELVNRAARALGPAFDPEVLEIHHKAKRDAPSGTALALGEAIASGRDLSFAEARRASREGEIGPRREGEIGLAALRGGDVVGEHTVFFLGQSERIELSHRATSRAIFAQGAVRAAVWVVGKPPGLYTMRHVLGLA